MALTAQTILERTRLFRGLPSATIRQLAALSIRRSYGNGAIVFSQADPGDALYGVITGKIRISASSPDGREMFLNIMEPGDTFGEIALSGWASPYSHGQCDSSVRADHYHPGRLSRIVKARTRACEPCRSASLRAHSLDQRFGRRIGITRGAGATGAAFT